MRAAITGASGLVGANLAAELHAAGWEVVAIRRRSTRTAHLSDLPIRWEEADLSDTAGMTRAFSGADVVYHCAAAVEVSSRATPATIETNVEGTRRVVEAVRAAGAGRLVHVSSAVCVGLSVDGAPADEGAPFNFAEEGLLDGYCTTKREAERIVMEAAAAGLPAVVVNPSFMLGPRDARPSSAKVVVEVLRGRVPGLPAGANSFVDVRDVARGMMLAAERGRVGERYLLAGHNLDWSEVLVRIAELGGVRPPRFRLPFSLGLAVGHVSELVSGLTGRPPLLTTSEVRWSFTRRFLFSSAKAERELGYRLRPFDEAIRDTIGWLRAQGMAPMILLRNADLYAPEALGERDLLLGGDRILAIGPYLSSPPADWPVEEIDLAGLLLLPGLIDGHTHLTGGGGEGGAETRVPALQVSELSLAGVTTAIGLLGTDCTTRSIAELLAVARGLDAFGLTALCFTGGYMLPPPTLTGSVRGDIVHIDRIVAVGEVAISDHRSSQPTHEELARLAADAHVAGMMTKKAGLLHLHLGDGPRGLDPVRRLLDETELPPRVFHPTHLNRNRRLWEQAKALSPRGLTLDVTAFDAEGDGLTAAEAIEEYLAADLDPGRITLSSDGGGCLPTFDPEGVLLRMGVGSSRGLLATVADLVNRGVELPVALATCTSNVATLYRMGDCGRLRVGARADLVAVDHNLRPRLVIAGGRVLVRDGEPLVRGLFERGGR